MTGSENRQVRASAVSFLVDNADLTGLKALLSRADWFTVLRNAGRLEPGELPNRMLTIPSRDAQLALREIVRLVADLPTGTSSIVVWQQDGSELWVDTGTVALACREGLVTISVTNWGAQRIYELLSHAELDTLQSFGQGQVALVEAEVPSQLVGRAVSHISVPGEIIVVAITRQGEAFLPLLGSEFRQGDLVQFAVHASAMERLEMLLGLKGG